MTETSAFLIMNYHLKTDQDIVETCSSFFNQQTEQVRPWYLTLILQAYLHRGDLETGTEAMWRAEFRGIDKLCYAYHDIRAATVQISLS
jgi:hypothetical protein